MNNECCTSRSDSTFWDDIWSQCHVVIPCDALGSTLGFKRKGTVQIGITRLRLEQSKRTPSEVQLSFAGLRHFSDQQLEDLMTHLPRGVQVFHLDASWLLDLDCNKSMLKDESDESTMIEMIEMMHDGWRMRCGSLMMFGCDVPSKTPPRWVSQSYSPCRRCDTSRTLRCRASSCAAWLRRCAVPKAWRCWKGRGHPSQVAQEILHNVSDSSGSKVSALFFWHRFLPALFSLRSRTHLRTLQLWFVSLPGKGPGWCFMDRIMGRSGLDGIARCSGLNMGLFGRALAQLQNLEERQCCWDGMRWLWWKMQTHKNHEFHNSRIFIDMYKPCTFFYCVLEIDS